MPAQRMGRAFEQQDARGFLHLPAFDIVPHRPHGEQPFGGKEGGGHIGKAHAFLFGQFEGVDKAHPVDQPVGDSRGQNFPAQAVVQDVLAICLAHGGGEGGEQVLLQPRIIQHARAFQRILKHQFRAGE